MSRGLRYLQNKNLNKDFTKVTKQLNEVQVETLQIKEENTKLRQQLAQKDYQIQAKNWTRFREGTKSLLIGDATVQNIVQEILVRTDVKVNKKGIFSDIKSELVGRLEADKIITYGEIFLAAGSQDCVSDVPLSECLRDAKAAIECSKSLAEKMTVSSICPRVGFDRHERTDGLNAELSNLCTELEAEFVNNDDTFYLNNGTFNEGYMYNDGKTLNRTGTNKLCKNLKLPNKHNISDVTWKPVSSHNTPKLMSVQEQEPAYPMVFNKPPSNIMNLDVNPLKTSQTLMRGDSRGNNHRCMYCFETGHTTEVCRHCKPLRCTKCLALGHKSKFCSS